MSTHNGDGTGTDHGVDVSGVLFDPRDMSFTVSLCGNVTYRGSWDESLTQFSGDGAGCGLDFKHLDLYR